MVNVQWLIGILTPQYFELIFTIAIGKCANVIGELANVIGKCVDLVEHK